MKNDNSIEINWNARREYLNDCLNDDKVNLNPFDQFKIWYKEAHNSSIMEPNAMALATVGEDNKPSVRFVLCKGFDELGLYFYTNYNSQKGKHISRNAFVAATFYWDQLERQVRIEGEIKKTSKENSDSYFDKRPRDAQIGAISSHQSQVATSRAEIEQSFNTFQISSGKDPIKRPENWGGYLIEPQSFEFWQGRENRLHDRIFYEKSNKDNWIISRLYP